ncbi:MAG: CSLREA domain-containing protein, partial [Anaerolineales bacterium]|nr:CSLREA domain-containing protein [Anaerolineales bacterium]
PLANNGGPTQTHRPGAGSDAIDAIPYGTTINNNGTSWTCNALNTFTDQRGVVRPQGLSCDSGAYEVEAAQTGPNFVVNTAADTNDGFCDLLGQGLGNKDCTLREAINAANDDPDASEITFAGEYTITLTAVLPNIATETTINGAGRSITVDGDNSYTIFTLQTSALTMMNLTLANGVDTITNGGDLTILNSIIRDGTGEVGGIYSG